MKAACVLAIALGVALSADGRKLMSGTDSDIDVTAAGTGGSGQSANVWSIAATDDNLGYTVATGIGSAAGQNAVAALDSESKSGPNSAKLKLGAAALGGQGSQSGALVAGGTSATPAGAAAGGFAAGNVQGNGVVLTTGNEKATSLAPWEVVVAQGTQAGAAVGKDPKSVAAGLSFVTGPGGGATSVGASQSQNSNSNAAAQADAGAAIPVGLLLRLANANTNVKTATILNTALAEAAAAANGAITGTNTQTATNVGGP